MPARHRDLSFKGGPLDGQTMHLTIKADGNRLDVVEIVYGSGMYAANGTDQNDRIVMGWIGTGNA